MATAISFAINSAVATLQANINIKTKYKYSLDDQLYLEISKAFNNKIQECAPHHGGSVGLVKKHSGQDNDDCGGAEFAQFSTSLMNKCP